MRCINQAGVETDPINRGGKNIGWQAKFLETRLSEHKKDFMQSIDTAKKRYPKIDKIFFYTNQDFGQGQTDSPPKYKKEIEKHAKSKGIEIEWRTKSFFESPFVCEANKTVSQHFFEEKSIFDLIKKLSRHTQNILSRIHSEIKFKEYKIKIERSFFLEKLKAYKSYSQPIILTGEAGVGKTAVIKDFYKGVENKDPLFIFKAIEFNISHINQLFKNYGDFSLEDFIEWHQKIDKKYIIIDSAEKLFDIENKDPFQEFLSSLIKNKWQIIFTTRYSYFDDISYQLLGKYNVRCSRLIIQGLTVGKISKFSKKYDFKLPKDLKFLNILKTPFHLNEYLENYSEMDINKNHSNFRKVIWNKKIANSSFQKNNTHIRREECFLSLAKKRADTGKFFVKASHFDQDILQKLEADEIIKYDKDGGGYFITHDIYEEWALNKIIERAFCNKEDYKNFFDNIGNSLPIRGSFRDWLSEKLYNENQEIKVFIEGGIQNQNIEKHWQDEILISVLLSNYCSHFFKIFKHELLKESKQYGNNKFQNLFQSHYEHGLLYKLIFLLRIACKETDESLFKNFEFPETYKNKRIFETIFTQPKGNGWICLIDFLSKNKANFDLRYINLILPVIEDWNYKNKKGETTRNASRLALFYYEKIMDDEHKYRYHEIKKRLIKIILNGSFEIKKELKNIFQSIISKKDIDCNSRYYQLAEFILLSPIESLEAIKNFPEQVIQLADLFWTYQPEKETGIPEPYRRLNLEKRFSVTNDPKFNYYPPSALNTPILCLLISSYKKTVDFILSFVNKSVESFAGSMRKNEWEVVEVFIDEKTSVKQYASYKLWDIYRGRGQAPYLLESMHMALEGYFIKNCKDMDPSVLEENLLYLLKNSKSASISAVVASVVLFYPEKTFNIAKKLFQTKEFFFYDRTRLTLPPFFYSHLMSRGSDFKDQICRDDRIESNKLEHRKKSLENLALEYQFFGMHKKEAKNRQQILWKIFDNYYQKISQKSNETEKDKIWRLCLARMDWRKMKPTVEKINGKSLIKLNPQIDPILRKHSEKRLKAVNEDNKYIRLKLWATYKFENKKEHKKEDYIKYENNPKSVIKETKDIIKKLENIPGSFNFPFFSKQTPLLTDCKNDFRSMNHATPLYTCLVLIRDYFDQLNQEDKIFCQEAIMKCACYLIQNSNPHQIIEGGGVAIRGLSFLLKFSPEKRFKVKSILLALSIKGEEGLNECIIKAVVDMWEDNFEDAHSIFLGYLLLRQKFDDSVIKKHRIADGGSRNKALNSFLKEHEKDIKNIIENKITYKTVSKVCNFKEFHLDILITAFEMLPLKTDNKAHKEFIRNITDICLEKLFISKERTNHIYVKRKFLENFSSFILTLEVKETESFLKPFLNNFKEIKREEDQEAFFYSFISTEDKLNQYENFWIVWELFYPKIIEICQKNISRFDDIIICYLLAGPLWKKDAKDWHTLKDREKLFFKKVSKDMGHHPAVLYSISKLLNDIGRSFRNDGILWISDIIKSHPSLSKTDLKINVVFYMENILRGYIFENFQMIKTKPQIKRQILIVLNFLIERGSATAYRLRESIL